MPHEAPLAPAQHTTAAADSLPSATCAQPSRCSSYCWRLGGRSGARRPSGGGPRYGAPRLPASLVTQVHSLSPRCTIRGRTVLTLSGSARAGRFSRCYRHILPCEKRACSPLRVGQICTPQSTLDPLIRQEAVCSACRDVAVAERALNDIGEAAGGRADCDCDAGWQPCVHLQGGEHAGPARWGRTGKQRRDGPAAGRVDEHRRSRCHR